jgi:hypothetical protein
VRPYLEKTHHKKRAGRMAQVVECLPSKCWGLEFKPYYRKIKKERKKRKILSETVSPVSWTWGGVIPVKSTVRSKITHYSHN